MPVSQGGESSPGGGGDGRWLWSRCERRRVRSSSASSHSRFQRECSSASASAWSKSQPALSSSRRRRNGWHPSGSTQSKTVNLERFNRRASGGSRISRPIEPPVYFMPHELQPHGPHTSRGHSARGEWRVDAEEGYHKTPAAALVTVAVSEITGAALRAINAEVRGSSPRRPTTISLASH